MNSSTTKPTLNPEEPQSGLLQYFKRKANKVTKPEDPNLEENYHEIQHVNKKFKITNQSGPVSASSTNQSGLVSASSTSRTSDHDASQLVKHNNEKITPIKEEDTEKVLSEELRGKYLKTYDFLALDGIKLYCELCRTANYKNVLAVGKKYLRDTHINQHITIGDHIKAVEMDELKKNPPKGSLEDFLNPIAEVPEEELMPLFRSIYWLSHNTIALLKCTSLHSLMDAQKVEQNLNYRNENSGRDIMLCIAQIIREDVLAKIKQSPFIGLLFDESTDIALESHLSLCIKFLCENKVYNTFIQLFAINKKDAESIYKILYNFLNTHGLLSKVNSISTDGASVLKSPHNGVCGKFKRIIPKVLSTHCIAHRLALGVRCLKKYQDFSGFNTAIHRIIYFISASGKRLGILTQNELDLLDTDLKLLKPNNVRWLSHFAVLKRIRELYPAIVQTLDDIANKEKDDLAFNLFAIMSNFTFIGKLHILCDILSIVDRPMKLFQDNSITINDYLLSVEKCIASLNSLYKGNDLGVYLDDLYNKFDTSEKTWRDFKFLYNEDDKTKIHELGLKIAEVVKNEVQDCFPDNEALNCFKILEISDLKQGLNELPKEEIGLYGVQEIKKCINYYKGFLETRNANIFGEAKELLIKEVECISEWRELKIAVKNNLMGASEEIIMTKILNQVSYPNLSRLYQFQMVFPLSTAECERTFSCMKLIKTRLRSCLLNITLDHHMVNARLGPKDLDFFEPIGHRAIKKWKGLKKRIFAEKK